MKKMVLALMVIFTGIGFGQSLQTFNTGASTISIPGELVYEKAEYNIKGGNVWAKGYAAIVGDSVMYHKLVFDSDKTEAYHCYCYTACLKNVFLEGPVESLDDPTRPPPIHLLSLKGKLKEEKFTKAVNCREYSSYNNGVVKRYEDYSLLFIYNNKKSADDFYKRLKGLLTG